MTKWLIRWVAPEDRDPADGRVRTAVGSLSGWVGIGANLVLFAFKLFVGLISGSVSVTADAMNNLSDASSSILTLVGFRLAGKPADPQHPFGHARFEYLSGLAVAAMIMVIGLELGLTSVRKILRPEPVAVSGTMALVLLGSIAVKLWLCRFNNLLGDRIRSAALKAAAEDSRNDCVATAVVLGAALVEHFADLRVDGIMGLAVAVFILHSGWAMARKTISPLLGERVDPVLRQRIVDYVEACPKVLGYHDLLVHDYGPGRQFASLHVEMDYREDPLVCHELIDDMERECMNSHGVHLVIHYDPVVTDDPELTRLRGRAEQLLKHRDPRLSLHDFRMVPGRRHMNLVFDVALPMDMEDQKAALIRLVEDALNEEGPKTYHVKITYDMAE